MRLFLLFLATLLAAPALHASDAIVVTTTIVTAQDAADEMARTGILRHCRRSGGLREGIGFGPTPDAALNNCCFYQEALRGRYKIVERGVARGSRGWFAVVRYR